MNKPSSIALIALCGIFLYSCGKDGTYPSVPQITFKSVTPSVVHVSQVPANEPALQITVGFKVANSISQDTLYVTQSDASTGSYQMPTGVPDQSKLEGDILVYMPPNYLQFPSNPNQADTVYFTIYVKDQNGHSSDTVKTSPVVLIND